MPPPKKYTQPHFFPDGNDLPLFSGTAPRGQIVPYVPQPVPPKQLKLDLSHKPDNPVYGTPLVATG